MNYSVNIGKILTDNSLKDVDAMTEEKYAWRHSTKPCRFLKERVYDSDVTGIPAGVEHACGNITTEQLRSLSSVQQAQQSLLAHAKQCETKGEYRRVREALDAMQRLFDKQQLYLEEMKQALPQASRDRYYTMSDTEAAAAHFRKQLGDLGSDDLIAWLTKGNDDDRR